MTEEDNPKLEELRAYARRLEAEFKAKAEAPNLLRILHEREQLSFAEREWEANLRDWKTLGEDWQQQRERDAWPHEIAVEETANNTEER